MLTFSTGFSQHVLCLLFMICCQSVIAQKLPSIQKVSLYAPPLVKVDGRANEWGYKYEAFNKSAQIFYTVANDDENLYLILLAPNVRMVQKTLLAGIVFSINHSTSKKDPSHVDITFPFMERRDYQHILRIALQDYSMKDYSEEEPFEDTVLKARHLDSLMRVCNTKIVENMKLIGVKGVASIGDTVISIYNTLGFELNARFNNKMLLTYELAIPLKYLGMSSTKNDLFAYHITLNGASSQYVFSGTTRHTGTTSYVQPANQDIIQPSDFWGEYKLAKKP